MVRKTKIVATIGPVTEDKVMLKKLLLAGVNVFRINLSHGEISTHKKVIKSIKEVREKCGKSAIIMLDTRGPEVRVKKFKDGKIELKRNQDFSFTLGDDLGDDTFVCVTQENAIKNAQVGKVVYANDGLIRLKITEKEENKITCKVVKGGVLSNNKGLFFAGQNLDLPYINDKDKNDILALRDEIDMIAGSFVQTDQDVLDLKELAPNAKIIAKIESKEGIKNIDKILTVSDGIMVARGDLGVELNYSEVPVMQKLLISKANEHGKISIVATEMLESMIKANRPTRAETSDVATAIYDGTCAIMTSAETAVGQNPIECIKVFDNICKSIEKIIDYRMLYKKQSFKLNTEFDLVCECAVRAALDESIKAIIVYTDSGKSAYKLCRYFSQTPIVAITRVKSTYNTLNLARNCIPIYNKKENNFENACSIIKTEKIVKTGDKVVLVTGSTDKISNCMKIETIN